MIVALGFEIAVYCVLFAVCRLQISCVLLVVYSSWLMSLGVCCALFVVCCLLFASCSLVMVSRVLFVVRCVLFVVLLSFIMRCCLIVV